jgi:hypothetical protein
VKAQVPLPVFVGILVVALVAIVFFMYKRSVPTRPPDAHSAAEGIRASIAKQRGQNPDAIRDKRRD